MISTERNISGLHHVAIRATNFDQTIAFYTNGLGFTIDHQWSLPQFNLKHAAMLRSPDGYTFIEVFDEQADIAAQGRKRIPGEPYVQTAILHLCLTVYDADVAYKQALASGAEPCLERMTITLGIPGKLVSNSLVYSPNGEVIEFLEKGPQFDRPQMKTIPRRLVTGTHNGKSVITDDAAVTNVSEHFPGLVIADIWATKQTPAELKEEFIIPNTAFPQTPASGTYLRYVQIPPDEDLGISAAQGQPHPLMHQTDTLDYVIILAGEIWLILDDEETRLRPGDIVIQRGTNHAWSNRSGRPCIQLAVLIGAQVTH